jgi:hypothetical protein
MYRILRHLFPALIATLVTVGFASNASAGVSISIALAPPPLPVYVLPSVPGPNYIWAPGYWAYGDDDYYWVPGTWVLAPRVGYLWTPGYWGWREGFYVWNAGYWDPHIGYYGGINYGHGYFGAGYEGGRWDHGNFFYNTAVTHVNTTVIHNTYVNNITVDKTVNNVSFNGGNGGVTAQPTPQESSAMHEQHVEATAQQMQHEHTASTNRDLYAKANNGKPAIAATAKPSVFAGKGIVATKGVKVSTTGSLGSTSQVKSLGAVSPATTTITSTATANAHLNTGAPTMRKTVGPDVKHANAHPGPKGPPHRQAKPKPGQKQNG